MRLDAHLAKQYPEISRSAFQKYIENGSVKLNGNVIYSSRQEITDSDNVEVNFPAKNDFSADIKDFARNIIYEDDNVIVINKPAGILTHSKGALNDEFTVADFVRSRIASDNESFLSSNRPGVVHRLDRATSGILIVAKNPETQKLLQKQFADRKAHKTYLAITESSPKLDEAKIDLPIGRDPKQPFKFRVDAMGKPAVTNYKILQSFDDERALVELKPSTGRTHQLRVHMAYIGAPILGDPVYGSSKSISDRMFLHAVELEITIPGASGGERKIFKAPLPQEFVNLLGSNGETR